ncbi:benzoyl-CoA oxygenase, component A [Thalassovita litoralis]|jgi:benzoyl-CoA 2,3-dioxygenase component A|uniref:Benzoyl-CoA oxygenase, component A n=1 Tax=Thalassovita litoralis TaxID=1010611 RepID=A0A521DS95_9RHOB|nr:benzoyl-CoA 2,3-epoxidase subunit BoxA [Thalassovita litoralis]SMO74465.1 benzoyl-CoA oxygenase, component A [Thalassovita litoralis]
MNKPIKQHLIDPEICIRCYTCEMTCPIEAIVHDDNNVVVDADKCDYCMACIPVCPTGSIDEWRVVADPYSVEEQFGWEELPEQQDITQSEAAGGMEALDDAMAALLAEAHAGAGGKAVAPASASKPTVNMYNLSHPVEATVQGNYRLTGDGADTDVRHVILSFQDKFPVLEGQSIGILPPGQDDKGNPYLPRLYSVSSPRDGERPNFGNVSLTVKREQHGICSNYVCDLKPGDKVRVTGPFGATFLMPDDPQARLLMVCTGTGSAPMRAFTMRRQRSVGNKSGGMTMFFGARSPDTLPYFGPLKKVPEALLKTHMVFSRLPDQPKEYVQDRILAEEDAVAEMLGDPNTYIYICGLRGMEEGVEKAFTNIAESIGVQWVALRDAMREEGRYHVETY